MHGIMFKQLKTYVESEWGADAWEAAMDAADIEPKLYLPVTEYPDDEAVRLVDGVVSVTDTSEPALLESLGEHMAPALLDTFKAHIREDWDVMDLLAHPDNQVFEVLRSEDGDPEEVVTSREGDDTPRMEYRSDLEMCELARGMVRGLAAEHGTDVRVTEQSCMHDGADACKLRVQRA